MSETSHDLTNFNMSISNDLSPLGRGARYRGGIDYLRDGVISGWAIDLFKVHESISVALWIDDVFISATTASLFRADISEFIDGANCGFLLYLSNVDSTVLDRARRILVANGDQRGRPINARLSIDDGAVDIQLHDYSITPRRLLEEVAFIRDSQASESDLRHGGRVGNSSGEFSPGMREVVSSVEPVTDRPTDVTRFTIGSNPGSLHSSIRSTKHADGVEVELSELLQGVDFGSSIVSGLKICIVTNELAEFHQNGGMGTANSGLVHALGKRGFHPTVLYTAKIDLDSESTKLGLAELKRRDVQFVALQEVVPPEWMDAPKKISYACFWYLKDQSFDIAHFNDYLGNAFYSAQARRTGNALQKTSVFITVHGTTRWAMRVDEKPAGGLSFLEICTLEQKALEYADAVFGVSHHLIQWLRGEGVRLPRHTYVHKNILPAQLEGGVGPGSIESGRLVEVVFFARQDIRKGFLVMLDAIRRVAPVLPRIKFTILGKFSKIHGEHSGALALDYLKKVQNLVEFKHDYDRDRAIQYLRRPGTLAVIPSLDENSPCTVFECIIGGIPFIASNVGGIPELVAPGDQESVLFEPNNAKALSLRIIEIAERGLEKVSLAFNPAEIEEQMFKGFASVHNLVSRDYDELSNSIAESQPLVSIIITHYNRPRMLANLLKTIELQTYRNFEVIIVDDGSSDAEAAEYIRELPSQVFNFPHTVVPISNSYLGAARNAGARHARGEYLKFQDDDNLPMRHELAYFVRAALLADADVVLAMSRFFRTEAEIEEPFDVAKLEYFPLGASLPLAVFRNEYGDANSLVRKESFFEDGGFTEIYGVGFEDYEFFIKSESLGRRLVFIPEPIFNYRISSGSMLQNTSTYRGGKRVLSGLQIKNAPWMEEFLEYSQDLEISRSISEQAWWRAGRRSHGALHRQMQEGAPDSSENLKRFLDLAIRYDRLEDVLKMIMGGNSLIESMAWLEQQAREFKMNNRTFLNLRPQIVQFNKFSTVELLDPIDAERSKGFPLVRVDPDGLMLHPLRDVVVIARVVNAVPVGAKIISVPFSHRGPKGNVVQGRVEVHRMGKIIAESDWVSVAPGERGEARIELNNVTTKKADLLLKSSVEGVEDFCWFFADHLRIEFVDI